ncbi:hypothetical protein CAOG_05008 [Capsaspora owczarzaki ATCC 30864]|uniref:hypothetical protein n=1 Tax=Capsaspora owczarzaki (strain ATCC 30864) TaxID=595528 RepID=UPI0003520A4D|nr:hypothetical protein CAOG_05008 [Capsaspora owczarzaki ATCC 30864]|eukprot:XP_004346693.2 hypothetical protein CAOG_05008 [Capsaspora owczarzaki ATCC 30864]
MSASLVLEPEAVSLQPQPDTRPFSPAGPAGPAGSFGASASAAAGAAASTSTGGGAAAGGDEAFRFQGVEVERDYSHGMACQFQSQFPVELTGLISQEAFTKTIDHINKLFEHSEDVDAKSALFSFVSCLCGFLCFPMLESRYDRTLKALDKYIQDQNQQVYHPLGLHIIPPIRSGLRVLQIRPFFQQSISR